MPSPLLRLGAVVVRAAARKQPVPSGQPHEPGLLVRRRVPAMGLDRVEPEARELAERRIERIGGEAERARMRKRRGAPRRLHEADRLRRLEHTSRQVGRRVVADEPVERVSTVNAVSSGDERISDVWPTNTAGCARHDVLPGDRHAESTEPLDDALVPPVTTGGDLLKPRRQRPWTRLGEVAEQVERATLDEHGQLDPSDDANACDRPGSGSLRDPADGVVIGQGQHRHTRLDSASDEGGRRQRAVACRRVGVKLKHHHTTVARGPAWHDAAVSEAPATGTILRLPVGATAPFHVYVNGAEQSEGDDYAVEPGQLRFARPLLAGRREGMWKKLVMSTAGIGFYGRGDSIDVHHAAGVATGLRVESE